MGNNSDCGKVLLGSDKNAAELTLQFGGNSLRLRAGPEGVRIDIVTGEVFASIKSEGERLHVDLPQETVAFVQSETPHSRAITGFLIGRDGIKPVVGEVVREDDDE